MTRRGFTLIELLVSIVVAAILGVALTRLLVNDSRFVERQDAMLSSRRTARTAMNWVVTELRMVSNGGLVAAAPDSVTVRVPFAFVMTCGRVGGLQIMSRLPVDSLSYASVSNPGLAWRLSDGTFSFVPNVGIASSTDSSTCKADSIRVLPDGALIAVSGVAPGLPTEPPPARVGYLYQTVTYRFAASVDLPGRIALWRRAGSAAAEELVAPFDAGAGFGFLVGAGFAVQLTPPGNLATVRGLEVRFLGASEQTPRGAPGAQIFDLTTQVRFRNRPK